MEGKSRPRATPQDVLGAVDDLVATTVVGQQEFARNLGLGVTDLLCFAYVAQAGDGSVTAGDLAARAHVTTGAVTGIVNRLERGGFVSRRQDPEDRRRVRITAVPAAAERVREVYGPYHAKLLELFDDFTPDEIAVIAAWSARASEVARTYLDESCAEPPAR
ncbi:MarR family transcriptional regulator [Streptomyces sp. CC224B]|uniref:MarR family transcriptional regulator n=1 Tax=Streptomyces sp. CC224B TaxID=3044571 RepID=UPI0024A8B2C4|nr:MarR family transcriptional regulator [Streptomyces sp. CC224B]